MASFSASIGLVFAKAVFLNVSINSFVNIFRSIPLSSALLIN